MKSAKATTESLVSREFIAVSEDETVRSAVDFLKKQKADFQTKFMYIYVVNRNKHLTGVLQTRDLLLEDPAKEIHIVMKQSISSIPENAPLEKVIELFNSNSFLAVPVIDSGRRLIGIISRKNLESQLSKKDLHRLRLTSLFFLKPSGSSCLQGTNNFS